MTADIELLPLPEWGDVREGVYRYRALTLDAKVLKLIREYATDYARANVAHHTAAKDAEIEALREHLLAACDDGDEADADLLATLDRARKAEARAERLAEALRYAVKQVPELATVPGIAAALDQQGA